MSSRRQLVALPAGALALFLWHGLAQAFPWGTTTVANFSSTDGEPYVAATTGLEEAPPGTWVTTQFDEQLGHGISTLATDRSFAWVLAVPRESYSLPRFFALHALVQLVVAALLLGMRSVLSPLPRRRRTVAIVAMGAACASAVYGSQMNWLGMPAAYGLGQSLNHLVGWSLAFVVIDRVASSRRTPSG